MSRFFNPNLGGLQPYVPGEQPRQQNLIKLNTNELAFPPSPEAIKAARDEAGRVNLYSDPDCTAVIEALAEYLCVSEDRVFAGNGSDEVLAFCFHGFCEKGAAFADLTYGFYPVFAQLYAIEAEIIPLREDFSVGADDYLAGDKTVFIANPNSPTGFAVPLGDIEKIVSANPDRLVVVDEAYVAFGAQSAVPLIEKYDNIIVVGTLSKSHGLAGARLGYAAANENLIADVNRVKFSFNPYNVNRMTIAMAEASLKDTEYFDICREKVVAERERVIGALKQMGFATLDSRANFIFTKHEMVPAEEIYRKLRQADILVRWFDTPRAKDHLRITIGTSGDMDRLIAQLKLIVNSGQ